MQAGDWELAGATGLVQSAGEHDRSLKAGILRRIPNENCVDDLATLCGRLQLTAIESSVSIFLVQCGHDAEKLIGEVILALDCSLCLDE